MGPSEGINAQPHRPQAQGAPGATAAVPRKAVSGPPGWPALPLVNVYAGYSKEPAPMGVADYGEGPTGAYDYATNSSLGSASIFSLTTANSTGSPWMSFQLNVNLEFASGGKLYVYWVQDVAFLDTATKYVYFQNNIWNSSAPSASMDPAAVSGLGRVYSAGSQTFYDAVAQYSLPGNSIALTYPSTVMFRVNSSVSASRQPTVTFEYNDGYGWQNYDEVAFDAVHQLTTMSGFVVDGLAYNPAGLYYDSELILGGPGGGGETTDVQSDVRLQLDYWNGHNYQLVSNAYNFGGDTAEGIQGALSQWSYYPSTGGVIAGIRAGAGTLGRLWDQSGTSTVDLKTSLGSGTLKVSNSSAAGGTPDTYPFTRGEVTVVLQPGSYQLQVFSGANLVTAGKYSLSAGQLLQLRTPLGIIPLTLSYSVVGGGSGYSPPSLTYTYDGAVQTVALSTTPTVYDLDSGSAWSVAPQLLGSGGTERWQVLQSFSGVASVAQSESILYYHQYLVTLSYSAVGGGSGYSAPSLSGQQFGSSVPLALGTSPVGYWLDSQTAFSATNPLAGSTSTERWFASVAGGTVAGASATTVAYSHQFLLTLTGGGLQSLWYDSGTNALVNEPETYGRSSGTGLRLVSYSLDSGQQNPIAPTGGNFTVAVLMNAPHAVSFASVTQYQVSIGPSLAQALSSITPPTIGGDSYWYDSGSTVTVALDGTWARSAGVGERLVSYSVDGGAQVPVSATGPVTVLSLPAISSPQSVAGRATAQFFLGTGGGSLVSVSQTPIGGDAGWYDNQTAVVAAYDYVWNGNSGNSRLDAVSYSVDGGQASVLPREGSGTFTVSVTMDGPHQIEVEPLVQYSFTYSGGFDVTLSAQSPTKDEYYDANSSVSVSSGYIGDVVPDRERGALTGYVLDSATQGIARSENGTFTTPQITFDTYHSLAFQSVEQYFVAFAFTDASGASPVTPSSLTLDEGAQGTQEVPGFNLWLDNGTAFTLASVVWEGADVKPLGSSPHRVDAPENVTVASRIYAASMKVTDLFGLAVQGASVSAKLVNGTTLTRTTNSSGVASLGLIPIGTYQASVSNLGASTSVSADASVRGEAASTVDLSVPVLGAVVVLAALAVGALLLVRRSRARVAPSTEL